MMLMNDPFDKIDAQYNDLERVYDLPVTDKETYIIYDALEEYFEAKQGTEYFEQFIRPYIGKLMDKVLKFQNDNKL